MGRQQKELDDNHFVARETKLVIACFLIVSVAKLHHLPLNMSLCESPEHRYIKWRSRQKRPVTLITLTFYRPLLSAVLLCKLIIIINITILTVIPCEQAHSRPLRASSQALIIIIISYQSSLSSPSTSLLSFITCGTYNRTMDWPYNQPLGRR